MRRSTAAKQEALRAAAMAAVAVVLAATATSSSAAMDVRDSRSDDRRGGGGCRSDMDCSLLGSCDATSGTCTCMRGWTGTSCARADLEPLDPSLGYQNASFASWGGRPVYDPVSKSWQLFATEIAAGCPLFAFEYDSTVMRGVSTSGHAGGPYVHEEVVLPPFHHNPTIVGPTPDGLYLMFFIGANNASGAIDCPGHKVPPHIPLPSSGQDVDSNKYVTMAWTKDLVRGPWQQRVVLDDHTPPNNQSSWHCSENNPAAMVLPNGTVVLVYRSNACKKNIATSGEHLGVAVAPHWSGTFVRDAEPIVAPSMSRTGKTNNEDPFLWHVTNSDGNVSFHIVNHQQGIGNVCGDATAGHTCGAHWFARNPHGPWHMSPEPVYGAAVTFANGTTRSLQTRQRPQLVFSEEDGQTPTWLFNGASFDGNNPDMHMLTHTFAFAFRSGGGGGGGDVELADVPAPSVSR